MSSAGHQLTFNNHFEFGRMPDELETFLVSCGPVSRPLQSPIDEAIKAAQLIYDNRGSKKIQLLLSGGIDSECMAQAFLKAKVPFEAIFMRFKNNLNDFDIKTNIDFCHTNQVKFSFVDLDVIEFFESGLFLKISEKYECQSPQLATHLWLMDQVDGVPVMGGNPVAPIWKGTHWFYLGLPGELHSVGYKYLLINERPGVPWFFLYTPELIASFFRTDVMADFLQKKIQQEGHYTYLHKCQSYQQGGFGVQPRKDKFTGFELVRKHFDEVHGKSHGVAFDELYRNPLVEMFPFPQSYIQLVPKNYFPEGVL